MAANNKCQKAHHCNYHANIAYPLGKLKQFPKTISPVPKDGVIPNVIHQFSFQPENARPHRWMSTWQHKFCPATGFKYELWTWDRLKKDIGLFYCANLYNSSLMDESSLRMLALEVLESCGGYYIPLSTIFVGHETDPEAAAKIFGRGTGAMFESGSIVGSATHGCTAKILECYENGSADSTSSAQLPSSVVTDMKIGDDRAAFASFRYGSRHLGASRIYFASTDRGDAKAAASSSSAMIWAYDCQVPIFNLSSDAEVVSSINGADGRVVVITDSLFGAFSSLIDELAGVMYRFVEEETEWDYIVFNVEWETDSDGFEVYPCTSPFRSPTARYLGFIANKHVTKEVSTVNVEQVLAEYGSGKVFVASEKSRHTAKLASIYRTIPSIERACSWLAGYFPDFNRDSDEVHGDTLKGFRNGQIAFELQVDDEQRVMYRTWGSSGGIDCECKIQQGLNGLSVEWLRRYQDGQVMYETTGEFVH